MRGVASSEYQVSRLMAKLVIVTGAGASKDFCEDFGTGNELLKAILYGVSDSQKGYLNQVILQLEKVNQELGRKLANERVAFAETLYKHVVSEDWNTSIDRFINLEPSYKDIASFCIAFHIAGYEGASFKNFNYNEHWLFRLCNILEHFFKKKELPDIEVITFNYDRLIESYIHWYFTNRGLFDKGVSEFINKRIFHVYGSIGKLPFQERLENSGILYGMHNSRSEFMNESSKKFSLMYHGPDINDTQESILKKSIENAGEVWFMGFGFDEFNCAKLGIEKKKNNYFTSALSENDEKRNSEFVQDNKLLSKSNCSKFFNWRVENNTVGLLKLWEYEPWGPY